MWTNRGGLYLFYLHIYIYIYIFEKKEYSSTLVVKFIMKKKGDEDQDTKTSLIIIGDVYLQVWHVNFFFNMTYAFHCLIIYRSSGSSNIYIYILICLGKKIKSEHVEFAS